MTWFDSRCLPRATKSIGARPLASKLRTSVEADRVQSPSLREDRVLRVGIVGCGKIADSHVEQVRAVGLGDVVAVCDREPLMAEQLAARFAIPARYTDVTRMLADERLDVVHVATPPDSHVVIACLALEAGCHVFVEKPFALTMKDAAEILGTAERCGRRVAVNYLYNFSGPGLQLSELLANRALGDLVHCHTTFGYDLAGDYGLAVLSDANHWVHRLPGPLPIFRC